jgi:hypothetical protein
VRIAQAAQENDESRETEIRFRLAAAGGKPDHVDKRAFRVGGVDE